MSNKPHGRLRDNTLPHYLLDVIALKMRNAQALRFEAKVALDAFAETTNLLDNAAVNGDAEAQAFIGRIHVLRRQLDASTAGAAMLSAVEAAQRIPGGKGLKPDGTPQDSVYRLLRAIGAKTNGKWYVAEDRLEAHIRGEAS